MTMKRENNDDNERLCKVVLMTMKVRRRGVENDEIEDKAENSNSESKDGDDDNSRSKGNDEEG